MGILKLFCTATDGRTIYGLAAAGNYSLPDATPGLIENTLIILVKSNLDPVSLASLTWSVVSTVKLSSIYDITQSKRRELCLVDDKGVFTYMGQNVLKSSGDSTGVFGGVQYSPVFTTDKSAINTGQGGWRNINVQPTYSWQQSIFRSILFYVKTNSSTNTIIHAYITPESNSIQFGIFNDNSIQFERGPLWEVNTALYGNASNIQYVNNMLFVLTATSGTKNLNSFSVPFSNSTISTALPTTDIKMVDTTSMRYCYDPADSFSGVFANSLFVICNNWDRYIASMDTTSSNSLGQPLPIASSSPIESMDNTDIFQPMGVSNGGTAFALIQQTDPSTNTSTLSALNLNLGQAGAWQRVDYLVNITDTLGVNPNPDLSPGPKSSNPSIRWIAGSVSGGLIVLAMIFYFGYYRRRRDQRLKDKIAALDEMKELGDQKQEVNNLEDSTKIDPNPTTTTQQTQIDPRLLQQFRLTSHPRPNMVATATQDDVSDSRTTLNPQGAPLNPQLRYEYGQEPPSNPPRIPSHSRPLVPACEPHAIVPTEYHIPPNNPHADISPPTIRVEEIIPSIWDPVIHAPHTEPNF